nr:hybrid sensor histidine kinase/response regulator [Aliiglaciecola sp. M165]
MNINKNLMWMSIAALLFFVVPIAQSQSPLSTNSFSSLQLINKNESLRLNGKLKYLSETDEQLTIEDVRKRTQDFQWHLGGHNPNYGIRDKGFWLHTRFSNVSDIEEWVIDIGFSHLDKADFYFLQGKTLLASSRQGKLSTEQTTRFPTLKVDLPNALSVDLFIRLESSSTQVIAPVDIQPYQKYLRTMFWDNLMWGLFYGGLIILAIYNLVLYISNQETSLLAYVGYICTALVWQFVWGGHSIMLLSENMTVWLSKHMDLIFILIGIASGFFTYTFLNAKETAPKSTPFIKTNIGFLATLGFCSLLNLLPELWQNSVVYLTSLFAIASYLAAGFESYSNRFRPARYFIFAWTILALAAITGMLSLSGILPTNAFTTYCFQVGIFIEAGLFSLAIMDKNRSQLEYDIQQATNDLRNNVEFIEEQNARLDIARKDAINASNIKSQFLANMSHEIRTPLNAILGFSKELLNTPLPVDKQEHVRIINFSADSLLGIVNDVLDVSKIEAGKLQINNQPFSPNDVLEEMVSVMAKSAHQKNLEFHFELNPLPEKLVGDAQRIKQILTNLLGNALKFTPSGHISLKVAGKVLKHGMFELKFVIEDTGIGISQQDKKKLFNAFTQIDDATSRSYQGTGLGLVICQQLVRLMGGKIGLTSRPGNGSCFTVSIMTNLLNKTDNFSRNIGWNNRQVLIYETDPEITHSTAKMLSNVGAQTTLVSDIKELKRIKHKFSDVFVCLSQGYLRANPGILDILLNAQLPELVILYSGYELVFAQHHKSEYMVKQLRLPLTLNKLASLTELPIESQQNQLQSELLQLPSVKILAVDDMEMNLRLLKTWFKPSKVELFLAYTGEEAVNLCKENEFDLILMDVQMPNMDGLQASKLIRQTHLNLGTPIIAVTAHALKEEQERLMASGMDDYLPKPLDLSDLIEVIQRWCALADNNDLADLGAQSIDWSLALKRANQNRDAALELLNAFIEQLPNFVCDIKTSWENADRDELKALIHKLHGASCYTGVPKLLELCEELEIAIKSGQFDVVERKLPDFFTEAEAIIEQGAEYATASSKSG